jgi:hypothetical protein
VVHQAQAQQLRGPLPAAFGRAYLTLEPIWQQAGARALGPVATLGDLLVPRPSRSGRGRPRPGRDRLAPVVSCHPLRWRIIGPGVNHTRPLPDSGSGQEGTQAYSATP